MSTASAADIFPAGSNISGGIPIKSQDLAASIVFAIAYFILLPLGIFSVVNKSTRCLALIRPLAFIQIRIASFIIRAVISNGNYATGLFIAEQVMLLSGFIALVEPLVTMVGYQLLRTHVPTGSNKPILLHVQRLLRLALLVALILGIVAASQYGSSNNASTLKTIKACRDANVVICIVITCVSAVVAFMAYFKERPRVTLFSTVHLITISALLAIASIYKIVFYVSHANPIHVGTKVAFYLLAALPELLATILFFAINLNEAYEIPSASQKEKDEKKMRKGIYNGPGYTPSGERLDGGLLKEERSNVV